MSRNYLYSNTKETVMDLETFKKLTASSIDKTIRENAKKRKDIKNG